MDKIKILEIESFWSSMKKETRKENYKWEIESYSSMEVSGGHSSKRKIRQDDLIKDEPQNEAIRFG